MVGATAVSDKDLVGWVLSKHPETQTDDRKLILKIWEIQGLKLSDEQKAFILHTGMNPETIRRVRQKIAESGYIRNNVHVDEMDDLLSRLRKKEF